MPNKDQFFCFAHKKIMGWVIFKIPPIDLGFSRNIILQPFDV